MKCNANALIKKQEKERKFFEKFFLDLDEILKNKAADDKKVNPSEILYIVRARKESENDTVFFKPGATPEGVAKALLNVKSKNNVTNIVILPPENL